MISKQIIQHITDTARIEEVIADFVNLKKRGAGYTGLCPFHNEKTPSFHVSPTRGIFKCFGCGKGGDAINFVMEHEHFTYPEALRYLAGKYKIKIEESTEIDAVKELAKESLYIVNQFAVAHYTGNLTTAEGQTAGLAYFRERGINQTTIMKFNLGYALKQGDALLSTATKAAHKLEQLQAAGMVIRRDDKAYDFFRNRVIFPIHNLSGKVVAFAGRILIRDDKQPKYINSPETEIYVKSRTLYGIYQARSAMRTADEVYLVEGYTDVLSLHQAGIENVVASSGTSLTTDQVKLIKRFTQNITILYDGDEAGIKAALRGLEMILAEDMNVKVVVLPDKEDPDSYIRKHGAAALTQFISNTARNIISFKIGILLDENRNDPIKKAATIKEMVQIISRMPDPVKRSLYIKQCGSLLNMKEEILITEVNKLREGQQTTPEATPEQKEENPQEREIIRLLLEHGNKEWEGQMVAEHIIGELTDISLNNPTFNAILEEFRIQYKSGNRIDYHHFKKSETISDKMVDMVRDIISSAAELSPYWEEIKKKTNNYLDEVRSTLQYFKLAKLREMSAQVMERLKNNDESHVALQKKCMILQQECRIIARELGITIMGKL